MSSVLDVLLISDKEFYYFNQTCCLLSQAVFKRFLRPDKDYLSFSLLYNNAKRSLDLVGDSVLGLVMKVYYPG